MEELHRDSFGWALHCCRGDPAEAEDVLQTAYLKVLDGRARFGGRSAFKTWLFSVIRNTAADRRRRVAVRGRLRRERKEELPTPSEPPGSDEILERRRMRDRLREALQELSPRQREVLMLVFYHGMTVESSAEVMGVSVGSARTHYHRGKKRLREELDLPR